LLLAAGDVSQKFEIRRKLQEMSHKNLRFAASCRRCLTKIRDSLQAAGDVSQKFEIHCRLQEMSHKNLRFAAGCWKYLTKIGKQPPNAVTIISIYNLFLITLL